MKAPKLCLLQGEKKERRKICIKIIDKNCKNILNAKRMIKLKAIIKNCNAIIIKINTICFVMMETSRDVKNMFPNGAGIDLQRRQLSQNRRKMSAFLRLFLKSWRTRSVLIPVLKMQPEAAAGTEKRRICIMKLKKLISVTLTAAMATGLFAAVPVQADGPEEITWMFWDDLEATEDLVSKGYKEVLDRYNETYDGQYHVTAITTNLEEYDGKLNALVAAGQTPDMFICNPGPNMDVYVNAGVAADLTDILTNQEADWYSSFTDGIFERMTYDGKIMAVPTNFAAALCFYNTEIFDAAGVEVPTTYTELLDACQKIKDAGYTPISCSAGTAWCLSMVAGYLCDRQGVDLAAIADHTANWTDDNCIEAGKKLKELSQYFQETAAGDSNDQATANFYNGEAAILIQGSWAIAQINGNNPDFESKCGVFQFPGIEGANDPNRMIVKTDNLLMSATTEHQDAVIALMKMFTDETAQKYTAEIGGKIPIVKDLEIDYDKAPAQLKYVQDILANATGTFGFYNESLASVEAGDCFDNAMVDIFLDNQTPEEAFQTVQTFYEENVWE